MLFEREGKNDGNTNYDVDNKEKLYIYKWWQEECEHCDQTLNATKVKLYVLYFVLAVCWSIE